MDIRGRKEKQVNKKVLIFNWEHHNNNEKCLNRMCKYWTWLCKCEKYCSKKDIYLIIIACHNQSQAENVIEKLKIETKIQMSHSNWLIFLHFLP
jgi:hypothetical protein